MVLNCGINAVYRQVFIKICLFTLKLIHENVYWHGTGKFFKFLNRIVHAPTMIVTILFCEVNIFPLLDKLPLKITPHFTTE
jgi:hypothetical protein